MSNKEKSKSKTPMKDLLDELGIKRAPPDHPIYRTGAIVQLFSRISSEDEKGEDENDE